MLGVALGPPVNFRMNEKNHSGSAGSAGSPSVLASDRSDAPAARPHRAFPRLVRRGGKSGRTVRGRVRARDGGRFGATERALRAFQGSRRRDPALRDELRKPKSSRPRGQFTRRARVFLAGDGTPGEDGRQRRTRSRRRLRSLLRAARSADAARRLGVGAEPTDREPSRARSSARRTRTTNSRALRCRVRRTGACSRSRRPSSSCGRAASIAFTIVFATNATAAAGASSGSRPDGRAAARWRGR